MFYLTTLERVVLESLNKSPKNIHQLVEDTGIKIKVIQNITQSLIAKEILEQQNTFFQITKISQKMLKELIKDKNSIKAEIQELIDYSLHLSLKENRGSFSLQKVSLSDKNEKIINSMFQEIKNYISQVTEKQQTSMTKKENIIFWGSNKYSDILEHISSGI